MPVMAKMLSQGCQILFQLFPSRLLHGPQALQDLTLPTSPPLFYAVLFFTHAGLFLRS